MKKALFLFLCIVLTYSVYSGWVRPIGNVSSSGVETDPIFTASWCFNINATNTTQWNSYVSGGGVDTNSNVTSIQVTGTTTKTFSLEQNGQSNLTTSWTDLQGTDDQTCAEVSGCVENAITIAATYILLSTYRNYTDNTGLPVYNNLSASNLPVYNNISRADLNQAFQLNLSTYRNKTDNTGLPEYNNLSLSSLPVYNNISETGLKQAISGNLSGYRNYTDNTGLPIYNNGTLTAETDPQVGLTTASNICVGNGTGLNCNSTASQTFDLFGCAEGKILKRSGSEWECADDNAGVSAATLSTTLSFYINQTMISTYINFSTVSSLLSTYTNLSLISSLLLGYINSSQVSSYANMSQVQSLLSTYMNISTDSLHDSKYMNYSNVSILLSTYMNTTTDAAQDKQAISGNLSTYTNKTYVDSYTPPVQVVRLVNNTRSYKGLVSTNLTAINFTVYANNFYTFEFNIVYSSNDTLDGLKLGLWYPSNSIFNANVRIYGYGVSGSDSVWEGRIVTSGDNVTSTGVTTKDQKYIASIEGIINPTTTGKLQVTYASEVANGNITIYNGTIGILTNLTSFGSTDATV